MAHRFEAGAELRLGLAHTFGDGPHLAVARACGTPRCGRTRAACTCAARRPCRGRAHRYMARLTRRRARRSGDDDRRSRPSPPAGGGQPSSRHPTRDEDQLGVGELPDERRRQLRRRTEHDHQVGFAVGRFVQRCRHRHLVDLDGRIETSHRVGEPLPAVAGRVDDHAADPHLAVPRGRGRRSRSPGS